MQAAVITRRATCVGLLLACSAGLARPQSSLVLDRVRVPIEQLPIAARVDVPSSADWITFGFGSVWVVNYRPDRVSRIDAATNKLVADIAIGRNGCLGILTAVDRVWVATCGDGVINEIDPASNAIVRRIPVPIKRGREGAFAFLDGSFWVPDNASDTASSSIVKIDARTGATLARVAAGARADVVVAGFGSIWITSSGANEVMRVDPRDAHVIARIPVGKSPKFSAAGEGAVWVQNRADGSVSRIDPETNREVARIEARAPTSAGDISAGGGAVWLSVDGKPVTRIDARTNVVTHQFVGGEGADAIRWGIGAVWVADHRVGQLWRIDPTRIAEPKQVAREVVTSRTRGRIDSTLGSLVAAGSVAGVSALVWEKGKEAYFGAFGMADREAARPMRRDAIVQIFSMTKPVTGVALMTLYEQGKFQLDDPLEKYMPEFANLRVYGGADANGAPILVPPRRSVTIRDITRHTAGFATGPDNPGVGSLYKAADPLNRNNTLAEFARRLATVPLWFQPEAKWEYGPSVDVQAYLVERLSGQPFAQYVREHVLAPLRMTDTRYVVPESDRPRLAAMYNRSDAGVLSRAPDESALAFNTRAWPLTPGSYGLTSTLDDYMRFARMLVNGGELDGVRILKPETVRLMATSHLADTITQRSWLPSKGQVGFGIDFAVRSRPPATAEENNGVVGEFFWDGAASTLFWVDPTNQLTAVLFVQLMPFDRVGLHKGFRDAVYGPYQP
jgi:CubicO group peptidase (beta-lactamase class C family)/streptogramin lyase